MTLRACAMLVERWGEVSHVFGGLESWHLLRAVGRRPVLLTVALPGMPADRRVCDKVRIFAVESASLAKALSTAGVPSDQLRVIYPGVDLKQFAPAPLPASRPFRVLFASSPADPREFEVRGIPVLVEAAKLCPEVEFVLLWRQWGDRSAADRGLQALAPPSNVTLVTRDVTDMPAMFNSVHAVVCCYAAGFGKTAPNSVVEGLGCGRPALVSEECGIGHLIDERGAGLAVRRDPEALAAGVLALQKDIQRFSSAARLLAEQVFDLRDFRRHYATLHEELSHRRSRSGVSRPLRCDDSM